MTATLALIVVAWISLSYLIYRYARYSNWRERWIGRSFMMTKTALWAVLTYVLVARVTPHDYPGRGALLVFLCLYLAVAVVFQTAVIVRLQHRAQRGAFDRRSTDSDLAAEPVADQPSSARGD